ncbi:MAG: hypothetical protein U0176_06975 [Bacteroidia bacterium]
MNRYWMLFLLLFPAIAFAQPKGKFSILESNVTSFRSLNTQAKVARSGDSDVIIGWRSARQGGPYHNIYIQKVDHLGNILWEKDGLPLCPFPANQTDFAMVEDGYGGIVVVWEDYRMGSDLPLLFAQRINLRGEPLWGKDGLRLCEVKGPQRKPQIVSDLNKGFYVVWEDYRRGYEDSDIYAQFVDLGGSARWLASGMPIATAPNIQKNVSIATDEGHYLYLVWEDFRDGLHWSMQAQKLDAEGNFFWKAGGLDIFPGSEDNHQSPAMVPDGYGGILFVYQKYSLETHGTDIYRGRLSPGGELAFHFATCFSQDEQLNPRIVKKGSKALLVWEDRRNGNWDLYAQMIRLKDGLLEWGVNGIPVVRTSHDERNPTVISASSYGYQVFSWLRKEGNTYQIGVQKLDNLGEPAWDTDGRLVCSYSKDQTEPSILPDENGGLWCAWTDRRLEGSADIFTQHINGTGLPLLKPAGLRLAADHSSPVANVSGLKIMPSRSGDFYLVWEDFRNGDKNSDIYIQKLSADGQAQWRNGGIPVCIAVGEQNRPILVEDGVGGVIVAWVDRRDGKDDNIFAQRVSSWGKVLWREDGVLVCDAPSDQNSLRGVSDGKEGVLLCWVDARTLAETGFDLYIQRVSHEGEPLWQPNGKPFANAAGLQTAPSLAEDGNGGVIVAWMDSRSASSNVYLQHLDEFGMYQWEFGGRPLSVSSYHQRHPQILRNREGDLYIIWQDSRYGDGNEKLFMQCLTNSGAKLWGLGGVAVCQYPGMQSKFSVVGDETGNFWVSWLDERDRSQLGVRLFCQKYNVGGDPQWLADGIPIGENLDEWNDFEMSLNKRGYVQLTWNQNSASGKTSFIQKLHPDGTKKYEYEGYKLGSANENQTSPVVAVNPDGRTITAWIEQNNVDKKIGVFAKIIGE